MPIRSFFSSLRRLFRRTPPITVVSGLPRSGTSMMVKMLAEGGIEPMTDGLRQADDDNPNGYFELERVKKLREGDTTWLKDAPGKSIKVISALLQYLPQGYRYRVLFMQRNLGEVLASQRQMLLNRGEASEQDSDEQMARRYLGHLEEVDAWLKTRRDIETLYVPYNRMVQDPLPYIQQVNQFLGGGLDVEAMARVVDPSLYRKRSEL
jgi:hypothetical protein